MVIARAVFTSLYFLLLTYLVNLLSKNVLFFTVDVLRPELGAYGFDFVKSPNIDALTMKSMLFVRAYCQVAVWSPSRASLLTGRRLILTMCGEIQQMNTGVSILMLLPSHTLVWVRYRIPSWTSKW